MCRAFEDLIMITLMVDMVCRSLKFLLLLNYLLPFLSLFFLSFFLVASYRSLIIYLIFSVLLVHCILFELHTFLLDFPADEAPVKQYEEFHKVCHNCKDYYNY
jgi:hypothetical protein